MSHPHYITLMSVKAAKGAERYKWFPHNAESVWGFYPVLFKSCVSPHVPRDAQRMWMAPKIAA